MTASFSGVKEKMVIAALILSMAFVYSLERTMLGHSIPDEKRYIQSTREMVESGDYLTPRYHGNLRFQKPILFYWLIVLSYKIFGAGYYGSRFPSIAASLLNVLLVYLLAKRMFGRKAGIFSVFVISTCEVYFMYSRFATPDMTFIMFITAAFYFFYDAYSKRLVARFKYIPVYAAMAFAVLTKGPLGFIYPAFAIGLFLLLNKDTAEFKRLGIATGLLLICAISGPWFIIMVLLHGKEYIGNVWSLEIMKKVQYFSSGADNNLLLHYLRAVGYYAGMAIGRHMPWSLFAPAALVSAGKAFWSGKMGQGHLFALSWFAAVFMTLVLIWSKESYYVLALSAPFALFMGWYLSEFSDSTARASSIVTIPLILASFLFTLAIAGWSFFAHYALDMPAMYFSLVGLAIPSFMAYSFIKGRRAMLLSGFFAAALFFFAFLSTCIVGAADREPLVDVAEKIKSMIDPEDIVAVASSDISYHRLNMALDGYNVVRLDKEALIAADTGAERDKSIFCVITEKDYNDFVLADVKGDFKVVYRTSVWKKFHRQKVSYYADMLGYLLRNEKALFRQHLKSNVYLVTNKNKSVEANKERAR